MNVRYAWRMLATKRSSVHTVLPRSIGTTEHAATWSADFPVTLADPTLARIQRLVRRKRVSAGHIAGTAYRFVDDIVDNCASPTS